jgi:YggT family protein
MTQNELRNQEAIRHEEQVDRNIEWHQAVNLHEKVQGIDTANQNSAVIRIIRIVYFLFGAVEVLLLIRVVLHLLGANADNAFANFIYGLSATFVSLFASLVQNPTVGATGVLEITTILGIVVYMIAAWLIGRLIWLVLSRQR